MNGDLDEVRGFTDLDANLANMRRIRDQMLLESQGQAAGDCVGECGGNMSNLDCAGLAREKAETDEAWKRQQMASETYERDPSKRKPPPGYSNATNEDLRRLGLRGPNGEDLLNLGDDSNFNAAVFRRDGTDQYVIGFKGTQFTNAEDWANNIRQGRGREAAYYRQAVAIGQRTAISAPGQVEFVGHSLGGGLASVASHANGGPATTFNPAGLHPETIAKLQGGSSINAWHIKGEILNRLQGWFSPVMPDNVGRQIGINRAFSHFDLSPVSGSVSRHLNSRLDAAFKRRIDTIEDLQRRKGCPTEPATQ